jgi:hypothetical protein
MSQTRHPLAQKLRTVWLNKNATVEELKAVLEMAQLEVEKLWRNAGEESRCAQSGCNYRRYPASRFCIYHTTGNDTLAARLRRAESGEQKKAK